MPWYGKMKIIFEQNFKLLCSLCQMCVKKILSISLASISKQWFAFYEICSHPFNLCLHDCISKWIREHSDTFLKEFLSCLKMKNSLAKCLDWYTWAVGFIIKSEKKNWDTLNNCVPHEVIIFTKFHEDRTKIVDFLLMARFLVCPVFFSSDFEFQKTKRIYH